MNRSESKYFNTAIKMDKALISLLEIKDFAYITVSELCKMAGVNRSTFYLHYETLGDLLEETTRYLLDDFRSYFPEDDGLTAALQAGDMKKLNFVNERYLHPYLSYIMDNRRVFSAALSNIGTLGFDRAFRRMYEHVFNPILERFGYPEVQRPYVMHFYLNGITAVVNLWLKNDCKEPLEQIAAVIEDCIFGRDPLLALTLEQEINE